MIQRAPTTHHRLQAHMKKIKEDPACALRQSRAKSRWNTTRRISPEQQVYGDLQFRRRAGGRKSPTTAWLCRSRNIRQGIVLLCLLSGVSRLNQYKASHITSTYTGPYTYTWLPTRDKGRCMEKLEAVLTVYRGCLDTASQRRPPVRRRLHTIERREIRREIEARQTGHNRKKKRHPVQPSRTYL